MEENKINASSIKRQLQAIFAFSIAVVIISSYTSYYSNQKLIEASRWVNHTNNVLKESDNLITVIKDAESGQRGYILTQDSVFLRLYLGGKERAFDHLDSIRSLTADNPIQQQNVMALRPLVERRFSQMAVVLATATGTAPDSRGTLTIDYTLMQEGRKTMDELRRMCENIKAEENRLLKIRTDEQADYISRSPIFILIASIISIIVSLLAYMRIRADIDQRIAQQIKDEEKYRETAKRISVMEFVTHRIASGDYTIRSEDDIKDELGRIAHALNEMGASLEKNFNEMEQRNWFQQGIVNLSTAMRGERFVKGLAEKIVTVLAKYLDAPLGTLYIPDANMNLMFAGGFAVHNVKQEVPKGVGLVGQAIKDREIVSVDNLPSDYMRVSSSAGDAVPASLVVLPLVYNGESVGVIELGFFSKPGDNIISFLNSVAEAIAIAVNGAVNYEKMQNLLEETQAQAEELQSQHTEMESLNVELEAQAEKLQASEEELKVQQEELLEANTELEEKARLLEERNVEIAEKNKDMQIKAEQLALSTKYKSEFLANMSHELRTPLNSILLLSRLLKENTEHNLSDEQIEYAKVIQSSGNGLLSLIDEILDLSKIEAGKMQLENEQVSINGIVENMSALFAPVAKDKGIDFIVETNGALPASILTDKLRLEQVLKNLISNAIKFTNKGFVKLSIRPEAKTKGWVSFEVKDTGIGIPQDKQKLIFEAFQQADGSTRRKYGGTGLGLSISRELVRLLGGKLDLESKEGEGSCFALHLPASAEYSSDEQLVSTVNEMQAEHIPVASNSASDKYTTNIIPESIPDDRGSIKPGDKCILIIEDDINFAKSLLQYTRGKGYKGIVAVRGDEGLKLAADFKPLGILLDIVLPVKNGWQVIEELKTDPRLRHIPVHIMSSYSVKKESMLKGAINFIDKPMAAEQMQEIFAKLEHILNRETHKVLIVEDNPKHARALAYFLETFNIPSEVRNSVDDSISTLKDNAADCVILDMGIPDQKGYDILEKVKKTPSLENLPVIIFTGKSLSLAEEQRIKKYADSIVVKTAHSYQRMLDEVSIFLHLVEEKMATPGGYKKLGALNDVLNGKTVLIVDDDVRNIFSLTKALEKFGMQIVTAIDGKEALAKMEENKKVDIVLLDMMMPEMDGYETATRIRERREWKNLPIIAVTAKAMMGDRDKCIKAGASDYVTKPVDIDQLVSLLRVWLYERI